MTQTPDSNSSPQKEPADLPQESTSDTAATRGSDDRRGQSFAKGPRVGVGDDQLGTGVSRQIGGAGLAERASERLHDIRGHLANPDASDEQPRRGPASLLVQVEQLAVNVRGGCILGQGEVRIGGVGPAPPPPPKPKGPTGPVRVGGRVAEANLIRKVQPVYPPLAKSARVQGTVEFTATISKDGNIENLTLVRGHPLLVNAAREAVLQWKYRPTMLNGQPVEVVTDIIVNFTLSQ